MTNNNKYCHNCGSKIALIAKFCPDCGTSQASLTEKPPQANSVPAASQGRVITTFRPMVAGRRDDDDDEIPQDQVESIRDLGLVFSEASCGLEETEDMVDLSTQRGKPRPGQTFGDAFAEGGAGIGIKYHRDGLNLPPPDARQVLEDFKREASAVRPNESTVVGRPNS